MAEVLRVIDVSGDGRVEIVFGATTAAAESSQVAVWDQDELVVVVGPDGSPLEIRRGGIGTFTQKSGWSGYDSWGCADVDDSGQRELVTVHRERTSEDIEELHIAYSIVGAVARVVAEDRQRLPAEASLEDTAVDACGE